jgi:TonB family protein
MDVTDVLRDRMHEPPGLQRMAVVSVLAHAAVFAVIVVGPASWIPRQQAEQPIMTIALASGAPGATRSGGMTALGGRAVQTETLPDEKKVAPTRAAEKAPEMTVPIAKAPARSSPSTSVKQAPDDARGKTPTRGAEAAAGSTSADTGVRGQGFGLSTSGGVGGSGYQLDVSNFCCPSYMELMIQRIRQRWDARAETPSQVVVAFTIQRDGLITDIVTERSSGYSLLDIAAQRAVLTTRQLTPLPAEFPNPTLRVHLTFQYIR